MTRFPGVDLAEELGFTSYCSYGTHSSCTYVNEAGIFLDVREAAEDKLEAKLSTTYRLITMESGWFSFPHKNFDMFLQQINHVKMHAEIN